MQILVSIVFTDMRTHTHAHTLYFTTAGKMTILLVMSFCHLVVAK